MKQFGNLTQDLDFGVFPFIFCLGDTLGLGFMIKIYQQFLIKFIHNLKGQCLCLSRNWKVD